MTTKDRLAAEIHRAYEKARAARAIAQAEAEAARLALEAHDASGPVPFDEAAAAAELAQAEFADRVEGGATADEVRSCQAVEREARAAAVAAHRATRACLAAEAARLANQVQAADQAVADLEASRRSVVSAAAAKRLDLELASYRNHVQELIAGAQRIAALRTIVREPERSPNEARRFESFSVHLPALDAVAESDLSLRTVGGQVEGGSVRCAPEIMVAKAREQFACLTDELCGLESRA